MSFSSGYSLTSVRRYSQKPHDRLTDSELQRDDVLEDASDLPRITESFDLHACSSSSATQRIVILDLHYPQPRLQDAHPIRCKLCRSARRVQRVG